MEEEASDDNNGLKNKIKHETIKSPVMVVSNM